MLRLLAFVLLASASSAAAQTPAATCIGGVATFNGVSYACNAVDLLAHLPRSAFAPDTPAQANEVWGWTDPVSGQEIALVGLSNGVGFVDVSTPEAPVYLGKLTSATSGNNLWRTFRVYQNHLFVGSEASGHGIQVFDLTRLRGAAVPSTFTHDVRYTGVSNTHTLTIDEQSGYLYAVGTNTCGGGPHIVDVRSPLTPVQAGCFPTEGYTHEAQCLTYNGPSTAHVGKEICFLYQGFGGATTGGQVSIVDMTNKAAPSIIGAAFYPNPGYSHQGWLTPDGRHILINDEFDPAIPGTRTIVIDVSDLAHPEFAFNYFGSYQTYAHNLYTLGRYAFLSNYHSGLHILDISGIDAQQFTEVAHFDTYPQDDGLTYNGQWMNYPYFASGIVVATDITNGFFVLQPTSLVVSDAPAPVAPSAVTVSEVSPNPASGRVALSLTMPAPERVRVTLLDATGREVAVLHDGTVAEMARFATDVRGLPAGFYVVRVVGETFTATRRLSVAHR